MPGWLVEFMTGMDIRIASAIWNSSMKAVSGLLLSKPEAFSKGTWAFVEGTLYPFALSIGLSLLNLFFIIGWLQVISRLHENITLELTVTELAKVVFANVMFLNIKTIIKELFKAAALMTGSIFTLKTPQLLTADLDLGSLLFYNVFGLLYIITAIVCSFLILVTVYGRYIRLYLLVVAAPFALSTIVGGEEARRTFMSWVRTFILNTFEIVMIALTMVICFKLIESGISIFEGKGAVVETVNGFWDALNGLFTMIMMTVSVKGVNSFITMPPMH